MTWRRAAVVVTTAVLAAAGAGRAGVAAQSAAAAVVGAQDPVWSPDGRRVAVSALDAIWTMAADGTHATPLVPGAAPGVERDPVFSPDGTRVAFAADRGAGFDLYVAGLRDGTVTPITSQPGDERWPSFTPDGRIVFASRAPRAGRVGVDPGAQWDLQIVQPVAGSPAWQAPVALTDTLDNETYPRVSPDGALVAFISERDADDDVDLWVMPAPAATATPVALGARVAPSSAARWSFKKSPSSPLNSSRPVKRNLIWSRPLASLVSSRSAARSAMRPKANCPFGPLSTTSSFCH